MKPTDLSREDPRLTAYALGELEGDERAAIEAALRHDTAARAWVDEVRATVARVEEALAAEAGTPPLAPVSPTQRDGPAETSVAPRGNQRGWGSVVRFPQIYYVVGGLMAACFAVMIALWPEKQLTDEPTAAVALMLTPSASNQPSAAEAEAEPLPPPSANAVAVDPAADARRREVVPPPAQTIDPPVPSLDNRTSAPVLTQRVPIEVPNPVALDLDANETDSRVAPALAHTSPAPAAPPMPTANPAAVRSPEDESVVTLSPFEILVDRETGTASSPTAVTRGARRDRALLPTAPRGARFADGDGDTSARDNPFVVATTSPLSTFSPEVEPTSYATTREYLKAGRRPPRDAVRIEELLNYFPYRYSPPKDDSPFAAELVVTEAPWAPAHRLVRIGLKAREAPDLPSGTVAPHLRPPVNLVFLIDVSGSMKQHNKLPVVQEAIRRLVPRLEPEDRIAIVTYSGSAGLVMPSLPASRARDISEALDDLAPNRAEHSETGLYLAYNVARANYVPNGLNRVILCTDRDFHVGIPTETELFRLVANRAQFGITLSVMAVGTGAERPSLAGMLAVRGNGRFAYIENRPHAERLLAVELATSLTVVAKDVNIQVEFNPAKVAQYRLIGYENPRLRREDYNDERVDGAAIGAGHTITALYEIVPHGILPKPKETWAALEDLRYGHLREVSAADGSAGRFDPVNNELLTVKVHYRRPDGVLGRKLEYPLVDAGMRFVDANSDFKFAAAVAGFGMVLRNSPYRGATTMSDVIAWATLGSATARDDPGGFRREFIAVAREAQTLLR